MIEEHPISSVALEDAKILLRRIHDKFRALGELDMGIARLEKRRAQVRDEVIREEAELNAVLQRDARQLGLDKADAGRWMPDLEAGLFRRVTPPAREMTP
jgi:hypothetical protein